VSSYKVTFANFILRFGEKVLLDYVEEIVLPAFLDSKLIRVYGKNTSFQFYKVKMVSLGEASEPVLGIAGRIVKNTILARTQVLDPVKGLIQDEQSISSSPSAFFLLILNDHRLVYVPETRNAPEIDAFKATADKFLKEKYRQYIARLYNEINESDVRITKKKLLGTHPMPNLEVIPLTSTENIEKFLATYDVLRSIEFRMVRPNDEIDGAEIFREVRDYFAGMNSKQTKIISSNNEGLDKEKAIQIIHDASAAGNQEVTLRGADHEGNRITGNNEKFKIDVKIQDFPATSKAKAMKAYELFVSLVEEGLIRLDRQAQDKAQKIDFLIKKLVE